MDIGMGTIEDWFLKSATTDLPDNGIDYRKKYDAFQNVINSKIHPFVTSGADRIDGGELTDHGPEHIQMVIKRASELIRAPKCQLSTYEVYLLLTAIHLHDSGHIIGGRNQHESNAKEIIKELSLSIGDIPSEQIMISKIAEAHGGKPKDKLEKLLIKKDYLLSQSIRPQYIAAILKLADELAEDYTRSKAHLSKIRFLDKSSEIYHHYASSLDSVNIEHSTNSIELKFFLNQTDISKKFGKNDSEVYLFDEILARTLKTYHELEYCTRFFEDQISLKSVRVRISFTDTETYQAIHPDLNYEITRVGYGPEINYDDIYKICPNLSNQHGKITGAYYDPNKKKVYPKNGQEHKKS